MTREAEVQRDVVAALRKLGCFVAVFAQGRKTRQTPGIPDLYVFPPHGRPFWVELKAPGGKQRPEQREWEERCDTHGVPYYVVSSLDDMLSVLRDLNLVRAA